MIISWIKITIWFFLFNIGIFVILKDKIKENAEYIINKKIDTDKIFDLKDIGEIFILSAIPVVNIICTYFFIRLGTQNKDGKFIEDLYKIHNGGN